MTPHLPHRIAPKFRRPLLAKLLLGLLSLALVSCSAGEGQRVSQSKVRVISRQEMQESTPLERAMQDLANKVAQGLEALPGRSKKLQLLPWRTGNSPQDSPAPPAAQGMQTSLAKYLARLAPQAGFRLLESEKPAEGSLRGAAIPIPDWQVSGRVWPAEGIYKVRLELTQAEGAKLVGVYEVFVSDSSGQVAGDFLLSPHQVFDSATGLSWQRSPNPQTYDGPTAQLYCQGLILDQATDWRLPNEAEIFSLIARPETEAQSLTQQLGRLLRLPGYQGKGELFGYHYGQLPPEQACHWYQGPQGLQGVNLDNAKRLASTPSLTCQVKCLRGFGKMGE